MANSLNIVPNGIQHKRPVVIGMVIWSQARRAVILCSNRNGRRVKSINRRAVYTHASAPSTRLGQAVPRNLPSALKAICDPEAVASFVPMTQKSVGL